MSGREFVQDLFALPPESAFWRGYPREPEVDTEVKRDARSRVGLGPPPIFRHRSANAR